MFRKLLGKLANFYPNVVFYSHKTRIKFNNTLNELPTIGPDKKLSSVGRAALAMCAAAGESMEKGDEATIELEDIIVETGATGSYKVIITKTK